MKKIYLITKLILVLLMFSFTQETYSQAPVADFKSCLKVVKKHDVVQFFDLSSNIPTQWEWDVYDSITYANEPDYGPVVDMNSGNIISDPFLNGNGHLSKNPEFQFELTGCYTLVLKATNQNGTASIVKNCYIRVVEISDIVIGFGTYGDLNFNFGKIYDNGGMNFNYSSNQGINTKSYLKIKPENNFNITLNFKQIRLADSGDYLAIYDSDTINANKLLGIVNNTNNSQLLTFTSTKPNMFVVFYSNGSGVDSGFMAEFYTDNNPLVVNKKFKTIRNVINSPSIFVNNNNDPFIFNYKREWFVNDTLQTAFTNKDTLKYTFNNGNPYKVCIVISNCDSSYEYCVNDSNDLCESYFKVFNDTTTTYSGIIQDLSTATNTANYLWEFGDGDTSTLKTPTHTYSGQGKFNICLTVAQTNCKSKYCDSIGFDSSGNLMNLQIPFSIKIVDKNGKTSNIKSLYFLSNFKYYPNPVFNELIIQDFDFVTNKLQVYNLTGNVVIDNINNTKIDFSNLQSGVYFLKVIDNSGNYQTYKIIKY